MLNKKRFGEMAAKQLRSGRPSNFTRHLAELHDLFGLIYKR